LYNNAVYDEQLGDNGNMKSSTLSEN